MDHVLTGLFIAAAVLLSLIAVLRPAPEPLPHAAPAARLPAG